MSLPTPSHSVSHKWFNECVNHKNKLSLRHPLPTFGSFNFFQASLWLGVNSVLQKLTKSYKSELRHLFQCCILIPRKCPRKTPFQHTVPLPPRFSEFPTALKSKKCIWFYAHHPLSLTCGWLPYVLLCSSKLSTEVDMLVEV
jgi:hypothetical protein